MIRILFVFALLALPLLFMSHPTDAQTSSLLVVEDQSQTVSVFNVKKIIVNDGDLTDQSSGGVAIVRVDTGGGGGGGGDNTHFAGAGNPNTLGQACTVQYKDRFTDTDGGVEYYCAAPGSPGTWQRYDRARWIGRYDVDGLTVPTTWLPAGDVAFAVGGSELQKIGIATSFAFANNKVQATRAMTAKIRLSCSTNWAAVNKTHFIGISVNEGDPATTAQQRVGRISSYDWATTKLSTVVSLLANDEVSPALKADPLVQSSVTTNIDNCVLDVEEL